MCEVGTTAGASHVPRQWHRIVLVLTVFSSHAAFLPSPGSPKNSVGEEVKITHFISSQFLSASLFVTLP